MPNRSINTMPELQNPPEDFYLIGGDKDDFALFRTTIRNAIDSRENGVTGWSLVDGTSGDFNAKLNDRYYVPVDSNIFSFILPDGQFGDTFTLYSETSNVFVRNAQGTSLIDVIAFSVIHLLYNGTQWVNFSTQAGSNQSLFIGRLVVIGGRFPTKANVVSVDDGGNQITAQTPNFPRKIIVRYQAIGGNAFSNVVRPSPPKVKVTFVNDGGHRFTITARHGQSYQNPIFVNDGGHTFS